MTVGLSLAERNKLRATHNHSRSNSGRPTKTFVVWTNMIQRCTNEGHKSYPRYGGRGIKVCERWAKFENFLADMGEAPVGKQIDRKDVDGDYELGNCRWATPKENGNNRANNRLIEYEGREQTLAQWAAELGISSKALGYRLNNGWSTKEAFEMKLQRGNGWIRGVR